MEVSRGMMTLGRRCPLGVERPGCAGESDLGVAAGAFEGREGIAGILGGQEEEGAADGLHLNSRTVQRLQARCWPVFWKMMQATEFCKHLRQGT